MPSWEGILCDHRKQTLCSSSSASPFSFFFFLRRAFDDARHALHFLPTSDARRKSLSTRLIVSHCRSMSRKRHTLMINIQRIVNLTLTMLEEASSSRESRKRQHVFPDTFIAPREGENYSNDGGLSETTVFRLCEMLAGVVFPKRNESRKVRQLVSDVPLAPSNTESGLRVKYLWFSDER